MWNHNFDFVSEGNCTFSAIQQNNGSDRPQTEAAVNFLYLKKNLSNCIQILLFLSIFMRVVTVLFVQSYACHVKIILAQC